MVIVRSPVRISFGGGGTDISTYYLRHGGRVISAAITRYCSVMAYQTTTGTIRITSGDYGISERVSPGRLPRVAEPLILPKAVVARFGRQGAFNAGLELFLSSEVRPGTGLGSSSAMACALVRALAARAGAELDAAAVADLACTVEIDDIGLPIGKQDQYASAFGGLNTIDFSDRGVVVRPLGLPVDVERALSERLLLFSTGQARCSATILDKQRRDSADDPAVVASLHRIKELADEMCDALLHHDLDGFGRLLDRGWQEKKRLSTAITTGAIDAWYARALDAGALGGKITGAGGGGYLLVYAPPERQRAVRSALAGAGLSELTFGFDHDGTQLLEPMTPAFEHLERGRGRHDGRSRRHAHSSPQRKERPNHAEAH